MASGSAGGASDHPVRPQRKRAKPGQAKKLTHSSGNDLGSPSGVLQHRYGLEDFAVRVGVHVRTRGERENTYRMCVPTSTKKIINHQRTAVSQVARVQVK